MINLAKSDRHGVGKLFDYPFFRSKRPKRKFASAAARRSNTTARRSTRRRRTGRRSSRKSCRAPMFWLRPASTFRSAYPLVVKVLEVERAIAAGCQSVDLVINIGALKSGHVDVVRQEIKDFVKAAAGALTKIILEVCYLTDSEIVTGCRLIQEAGANYAKTSTGQFEGPSMSQVLLMRETLKGSDVKLKVAGVGVPSAAERLRLRRGRRRSDWNPRRSRNHRRAGPNARHRTRSAASAP